MYSEEVISLRITFCKSQTVTKKLKSLKILKVCLIPNFNPTDFCTEFHDDKNVIFAYEFQ